MQFTIKLIRRQNPSLALCLQNIIAPGTMHARSPAPTPDDLFTLELDGATLKRVIESMAEAAQEIAREVLLTRRGNEDLLLAIRAVMDKWFRYARQHRSDCNRLAVEVG